jgi:peptidoglycan/xylan/chitin deacetylase (PgdA/CDA1 family)
VFSRVSTGVERRSAQSLALTFDDGPDPVWTPRLLDLLSRLHARATFFMIAPRAQSHPHLVARMVAEGHAIGLHCDRHVRHSDRDIAWCRGDTSRALARLKAAGVIPTLWRTPWGDRARWSARVAREYGMRLVGWTVDTHDWRGDSAGEMFAAAAGRLDPGAIVLAHDGIGPGSRRDGASETLGFVELAAAHVADRGLNLEALR